jgi:hypothetical protein
MAGQGDRTFLLGDMADNFVKWFILGQIIGARAARFYADARISAVPQRGETSRSI